MVSQYRVEKNASHWSKDKLKELLNDLQIENEDCCCQIKELTKLEGEATANNRKSKLIFFYEFEIKGKWSGSLKNGDKKYKGTFDIPNLSEENEPKDIDLNVSCEKSTDEAFKVKECMRKTGLEVIRKQLEKYIVQLKEEFSQGIILPTKDKGSPASQNQADSALKGIKKEMNELVVNKGIEDMKFGVKIGTQKLSLKEDFKCRSEELYKALTIPEMVQAFTGSAVQMDCKKGGEFSHMNGNVTGEYVDLVENEKIKMKWRLKSWPSGHFSNVTMTFEERDGFTKLNLLQNGVPIGETDKTMEGWKNNYFNRIKAVFGFGAGLF